MDFDPELCHCVDAVCPECGHIHRIARCRSPLDANILLHIYRRGIDPSVLNCPECSAVLDPDDIDRLNRSLEWALEDL